MARKYWIWTFDFGLNLSVKGRNLIRMVPLLPLTDAVPHPIHPPTLGFLTHTCFFDLNSPLINDMGCGRSSATDNKFSDETRRTCQGLPGQSNDKSPSGR